MGNDVKFDANVCPPRWAEALLRVFLDPQKAENVTGALLAADRDSVHPKRGAWRADIWFVRQVAGCVLRGGPPLRNWLLIGLTLVVFTIGFSSFKYPLDPNPLLTPKIFGSI